MTVLRRLLLLLALMVWQGGFMFYGAVVVPVGSELLGHRVQGFVTQSVTNYLNVAGAVALAVCGWDVAAGGAGGRRRRWVGWAVLVVLLGVLAWLHPRLDELLVVDEFRITDQPAYRRLHQWYLVLSTVQWAGAVVLAAWSLQAWRAEDAARS
ncbi:MAG: hypothetical protein U0804_23850 [Gemmataceae bacterium]